MPWFCVDDKFWSHPKTIGISMSAVGVWTMCGTWCMAHLTDGYIPAEALVMVCGRRAEVARSVRELVTRNLWAPVDNGFQFVDWLQWQRAREDIQKRTSSKKVRMPSERKTDMPRTFPENVRFSPSSLTHPLPSPPISQVQEQSKIFLLGPVETVDNSKETA